MLKWVGSPGQMTICRIGNTKVGLTRWNNLAPRNFYRRDRRWQLILPLRPFKLGRRCLYVKVMHGYERKAA